jgi:hypothetical protein
MRVDLNDGPSPSGAGLKFCLKVASRNGCNPAGTQKREHSGKIEDWSDAFLSDSGQSLTDSDALSLAAALDRAISALGEVAVRARQGSFAIRCTREGPPGLLGRL